MNMVEKVAAAITGPCLGNPEEMARAAIKAMRNPTEEMCEAVQPGMDAGKAWRAMIGAALKTAR